MNKILTPEQQEILLNGICPDCGEKMLLLGPRGGFARNCLCGACRTEFNASPVQCERMAKPCDPARQKEFYHIDETHYPVKSYPLHAPIGREQLDAGLKRGCQDPACTVKHAPLTEIFLQSNCHAGAGLCACYRKDGVLVLTCRVCERLVVKIAVAP